MKSKKILIGLLLTIGISSWAFTYSSSSVETNITTITQSSDSSRAEVYPTNFNTEVFITGVSDPDEEVRVEVFDLGGLLLRTFVLEEQLSSTPITLNLGNITEKVIIVRVYEGQEVLKKQRLFKN